MMKLCSRQSGEHDRPPVYEGSRVMAGMKPTLELNYDYGLVANLVRMHAQEVTGKPIPASRMQQTPSGGWTIKLDLPEPPLPEDPDASS